MTTSQPTPFLSEVIEGKRIPEEKLAYFRSRLKNRLHAFVLVQFSKLGREEQFTKADLARQLGKKPEQITRWLGAPGNWTLDTLSDLLLGMGFEPNLSAANLKYGAVKPSDEAWRRDDDQLGARKEPLVTLAANAPQWQFGSLYSRGEQSQDRQHYA